MTDFPLRFFGGAPFDTVKDVPFSLTALGEKNIQPRRMAILRADDDRVGVYQVGECLGFLDCYETTDRVLAWIRDGGTVAGIVQKRPPMDDPWKVDIRFYRNTDELLAGMNKFTSTIYGATEAVTNDLLDREIFLAFDRPEVGGGSYLTVDGKTLGLLPDDALRMLRAAGKSVTDVRYFLKRCRLDPATMDPVWEIWVAWDDD